MWYRCNIAYENQSLRHKTILHSNSYEAHPSHVSHIADLLDWRLLCDHSDGEVKTVSPLRKRVIAGDAEATRKSRSVRQFMHRTNYRRYLACKGLRRSISRLSDCVPGT